MLIKDQSKELKNWENVNRGTNTIHNKVKIRAVKPHLILIKYDHLRFVDGKFEANRSSPQSDFFYGITEDTLYMSKVARREVNGDIIKVETVLDIRGQVDSNVIKYQSKKSTTQNTTLRKTIMK